MWGFRAFISNHLDLISALSTGFPTGVDNYVDVISTAAPMVAHPSEITAWIAKDGLWLSQQLKTSPNCGMTA